MSERRQSERMGLRPVLALQGAAKAEGWLEARTEGPHGTPTAFVFTRSSEPFDLLSGLARLLEVAAASGWVLETLDVGASANTSLVPIVASFQPSHALLMSRATTASSRARRMMGVRVGRPPAISDALHRRIADERAAGRSYRQIAALFEAEGIPTPQGGVTWHASTLRAAHARTKAKPVN